MTMLVSMCHFIADELAPLTLLGAVAAYLYPPLFLVFKNSFLWLFLRPRCSTEVSCWTRMTQGDRKKTPANSAGCADAVRGYTGTWICHLHVESSVAALAVGFIIVAYVLGAMASNVIVYLAGGVVAFSVVLTTVSTFLYPLLTPALVMLRVGDLLEIPFRPMMQTSVMTVVVPLGVGMLVHRYLGWCLVLGRRIAPAVAAIVVIYSYDVEANQEHSAAVGGWVMTAVVLLNGLGYATGWWLARLYGFDTHH